MKPNGVRGSSTGLSMTSSRPSTAAGSAADCRWVSLVARGKIAGLRDDARDITLGALCLSLGPLVYAASLATVAAMLVLTIAALIASRQHSVSIMVGSIRALVVFAPLLVWMLASAAWSLDGAASVEVTLRVAVLFLSGTLLVTSFAQLPLEQLRRPLIAVALGFSGAAVVVVVDLKLGGNLAQFLHEPRLNGVDPALGYGRAATLHATLLAPVLVGLLRLGFPRLAGGVLLLAAPPPPTPPFSPPFWLVCCGSDSLAWRSDSCSLPPPPYWRRPAYRPRRRWPPACLFSSRSGCCRGCAGSSLAFSDSQWLPCR